MKKYLLLIAFVMLLVIPSSFAATSEPAVINIYKIDGTEITAIAFEDAKPFIDSNGRTLIPLRAVTESLGADVSWDPTTSTAKVVLGSKTVELQSGKDFGMVNGKKIMMDTMSIISNGRTFVPLRFVSESLGYEIGYRYGKDALAGNKLAHMITIGTVSGQLPIMVDMGWKDAHLTTEQVMAYGLMFKKIPADMNSVSQVAVMGNTYYMSRNPSDGSSFNWISTISYDAPGVINIGFRELPKGWDEFTINSLTVLLGIDGTIIGTIMVKDIMSTYDASTNTYYASRLNGKVVKSGKYTHDYTTGKITWNE